MKNLIYLLISGWLLFATSCESFMDPALDSHKNYGLITSSRDEFMGVLYNAYTGLPKRINFTYEAATDNAVMNSENSSSSKAARGGISTINNPLGDTWENDYKFINRINWYIEHMVLDFTQPIPTPVKFDIDPDVNLEYFYFTLGEAYFLRAWYEFDLLQKYGGLGVDGQLYGFPVSTQFIEADDILDLPRNTYEKCVEQIVADCDSAYKYLPLNYTLPLGLLSDGCETEAGHASGIAAAALKARTYLYAASPAFNPENDTKKWQQAAEAAASAIMDAGFSDLVSFEDYFNKSKLNDGKYDNPDILFRSAIQQNVTTYESENFPPRAGSGRGQLNPSQNLVDAFPMCDGYPIQSPSTSYPYDEQNIFSNRDPRLDLFIVRNGETFANIQINTLEGGADAYDSDVNATRTGYYLQKLLDGSVRLTSGSVVTTTFAPVLFGRPELYLNFAEAAIQATGNADDKTYQYSAREVLAKVRNRALGNGNDTYLSTITNKEEFIQVVQNERRIELCFEDHRFWDLRRWSKNVTDNTLINEPVYGIYSKDVLEMRQYKSPYMPLPYSEILKTSNLINNSGWN